MSLSSFDAREIDYVCIISYCGRWLKSACTMELLFAEMALFLER